MAKSASKMKKKVRERTYPIKIPLFIIPLTKEEKGLFGALTEKEMVENLKNELDKFPKTSLPNRGKSKVSNIESLTTSIVQIGEKPALLIRASVFDSNLEDVYLNDGTFKSKLSKTSRLGGEKYFILFYPKIEGSNSNHYVYTWLQLVYEDPIHSTGVATSVAKKIIQSHINKEPFNVKLQSAIDDFKKINHDCPEVELKLISSYNSSDNDIQVYKQYFMSVKIKSEKTYTFKNMPQKELENFFRDLNDDGEVVIQKKAIFGKKEYVVKRERYDERKEWNESVEQLFNSTREVTKKEIDDGTIFQEDFVLDTFKSALENYLTD